MSKQHFEALAKAFKLQRNWADNAEERKGIRNAAWGVALVCEQFNANFDQVKFIEACGFAPEN